LSGTSRAGTPPKNSIAATWHSVHARWSIAITGRTNSIREQHSTIAKACTVCRRPDLGSVHRPSWP
jgi:hypothetical protein